MPDPTPHQPTDELRAQVEQMSSFGIPQENIARSIGISSPTLRKYYREELDTAEDKANGKVAGFLFTAASGDAITQGASYADCLRASMFWLKTRAGWKETDRLEHMGGTDSTLTIVKRIADAGRD
jgi:hypothetical protein